MPRQVRRRGAALAPAGDNRILRDYTTPGHPVAYSAPGAVAKHYGITTKKAKEILEKIDGYTLHREYKKPKVYNPYYVHKRREQIQGDLIDVSKIARQNGGTKFLLLLIDIFTKKMWVYPLLNKSARVVKDALTRWLDSLRTLPKKLVTDNGTEFTNRNVQQLLTDRGVVWEAARGMMKACVAERANKTLQILIYKHLSENETLKYSNVLQDLVKTYNRRPHRTLEGMTPLTADRVANENEVQGIHHARYAKVAEKRKNKLPFKVGDTVRVKTQAKSKITSSSRAYAEQFHGEYYRITRINRTLPIALYHLSSLDTGEHIVGGFYANELQRQRLDSYKIERVLGERVRNGERELRVKWKYFGNRWNEWIKADNIRRVYT